jgi:ADP-ribose pyrophosphatase
MFFGMTEKDHIILDSKLIYNGPVKLRLNTFKTNGKIFEKEIVEHNASVGIIPITNSDEIMLIEQFRYAINDYLIEIPAGKIENHESPIEAAQRELEEETGFKADLIPLTKYYLAPSYDTELMHLFVAKNIYQSENSLHTKDDDENISNIIVNLKDAVRYCYNGKIKDCKTVSAILLYYTSFLI